MGQHDPEANRGAIIMDVERVSGQTEFLEEMVGRGGKMIERIVVAGRRGRITLAKAGKIRCDQVVTLRQVGDKRIKLTRR